MSAERGHVKDFWNADKVLFLSLCGPIQTSLDSVFSTSAHGMPLQRFFFLKSFHRLPMPLRIKSKVLVTVYKTLKTWLLLPSSHLQATQEPQSRLLLQDHPVPCAFNLESSAPQYHYDSFLTSFTCMCKCLPFREVCPPLSSYPFIFLYTTYHSLTNVMLLLYDSLR